MFKNHNLLRDILIVAWRKNTVSFNPIKLIQKGYRPAIRWPIISAFLLSFTLQAHAQFIEYGGGIGMLNYAGDLARGYQITKQSPALQGVYRLNLSKIVSIKFGLIYGKVTGDDESPVDAFADTRNASFSRRIFEGSMTVEYHFLDYKNEKSLIKWSPYFFGGVGFVKILDIDNTEDLKNYQPVMPFGFGVKHLIGKQFSVSLEVGARKMFTDDFDGISDGELFNKNYQYGNPNDRDWYHYTGLTLTYMLYKIPCPFRYIPNKSIYD